MPCIQHPSTRWLETSSLRNLEKKPCLVPADQSSSLVADPQGYWWRSGTFACFSCFSTSLPYVPTSKTFIQKRDGRQTCVPEGGPHRLTPGLTFITPPHVGRSYNVGYFASFIVSARMCLSGFFHWITWHFSPKWFPQLHNSWSYSSKNEGV